MIERDHEVDVFEVTCDRCPEGHETFHVDEGWDAMMTELKTDGWSIRKNDDDEWEHVCPGCAESEIEEALNR